MSVSGIGSGGGSYFSGATASANKKTDPAQDFLDYMKKTPAEQMQETWLKSHGLSKEKLAAMTPEQREIIARQMAEDIKRQMEEAAKKKNMVNILV